MENTANPLNSMDQTENAAPSQITIHPDSPSQDVSFISGNKGLLIAIAVVLVIAVAGVSAMLGVNSSKQYKGLIERVKQETQTLKSTTGE